MVTRMMKLFDPDEMEEYIRRGAARRKDIAGYQMELQRAGEEAEMARTERQEVGAGRRLEKTHEFAKPRERAEVGRLGVETAASVYALERKKEYEPSILEQQRKLRGLDIELIEQEIAAGKKAPTVSPTAVATPTVPAARVAKPGRRKMRPSVKRFMWEGTPTRAGLRLPGLLAPVYGYKNIAEWLGHFAKRGYEYAYPRTR